MLLLSLLYFIILYVCCLGYMSSPATEDSLFCAVERDALLLLYYYYYYYLS